MSDKPDFTFSAREKRGDKPCEDYDLLMKIAVARYGAEPQWTGPVATALMKHRTAQVQLMLDAIEKVLPDMAAAIQYAAQVDRQLTEARLALALIQQSVKEIVDGQARGE
jgi:hypothetical protein